MGSIHANDRIAGSADGRRGGGPDSGPRDAEARPDSDSARPGQLMQLEVGDGAAASSGSADPASRSEPPRVYIKGWRLYVVSFSYVGRIFPLFPYTPPTCLVDWELIESSSLCLSLLLSTLETTIVSTSLVSITNALGGFDQRDWVVTSYLLTYTGFLVIYAKFSDILGRKFMLLLALALFTVFSIVCGSISSILQL